MKFKNRTIIIFSCLVLTSVLMVSTLNFNPKRVNVTVDEDTTYQKMDGIGANINSFALTKDWKYAGMDENTARDIIKDSNIKYLRMGITGYHYFARAIAESKGMDPIKDGVKAWLAWDKTNEKLPITPKLQPWFNYFSDNNIDLSFDIRLPSYYKYVNGKNPTMKLEPEWWKGKGLKTMIGWKQPIEYVKEEKYNEVSDWISQIYIDSKKMGAPVKSFELGNEINIPVAGGQYSTPEEAAKVTYDVYEKLKKAGLSEVKPHWPNLSRPGSDEIAIQPNGKLIDGLDWVKIGLENTELGKVAGAISFHSWWDQEKKYYDSYKSLSEKYNLPVWVTEAGDFDYISGRGAHVKTCDAEASSSYIKTFYKSIDWSHASRVYIWSLMGYDGIVKGDGKKTPSYYTFKQFSNFIMPESYYTNSKVDDKDGQVLSLSFKNKDGSTTIILINDGLKNKSVSISSKSNKYSSIEKANLTEYEDYYQENTKANAFFEKVNLSINNGTLEYNMPGDSVLSIIVR